MRSGSCPITTTTGDRPAASAWRTMRRISDSPSSSSSNLFLPIRRDAPAARITPATRTPSVGRGMDRDGALAERPSPAPGAHRENLRDHREGDLLRAVRPDVQPDGAIHAALVQRPPPPPGGEVAKDPLGALPRTQQPDLRHGAREQGADI